MRVSVCEYVLLILNLCVGCVLVDARQQGSWEGEEKRGGEVSLSALSNYV